MSNFTVLFLFVTLKTCKKMGFLKQAVGSFTNGFSGLKRFSALFHKRAPGWELNQGPLDKVAVVYWL